CDEVGETGPAQSVSELGTEDDGQSPAGNKELGMSWGGPTRRLLVSPSAGRDEDVDMRMVNHGACPGVKDDEKTGFGAEVTRIGGEFQQRLGRRGHENAVDDLLVGTGDRAQLGGEREGGEVVGAGE